MLHSCLTFLPLLALGQGQASAPLPTTVPSSHGPIRVERLATLAFPWGMEFLPDGRLLITEKPGQLRIWSDGRLSEPVRGVPTVVHKGPNDQGGLLDVAVDPNFATNRFIYLSFVEASETQPTDAVETGDVRFGEYLDYTDTVVRGGAVARGVLDGNELRDVRVIWRQVPKTVGRGHFGHRLLFGSDGKLYITSGERMRFDPAQSLASNLGKVVRINPDGSVPTDNPLRGTEGAREDIWSVGHRNILSAAFQPSSNQLWAIEMGPLGGDELNRVEPGKNYGWPLVSNGDNYSGPMIPDHPTRNEFEAPVRTWTPVISASGAAFYSGTMFPDWRGDMLVGGLSSMSLIRLRLGENGVLFEERVPIARRIRDVIQAPDGALLLIVDAPQGELLRLSRGRA